MNRDLQLLDSPKAQVIGHDAANGFAASQGQFELNVYKPLIALNTLDGVRLVAGARCS